MYAFKKQCVFSAVHLERKCLSLHNTAFQQDSLYPRTNKEQSQTSTKHKVVTKSTDLQAT